MSPEKNILLKPLHVTPRTFARIRPTPPSALDLFPSYIRCFIEDGFKTYEVLMRRLLRNWQAQVKYAVIGFASCLGGGFGIFLALQGGLHVIDRKKVVEVAEEDGLNGKEVRNAPHGVA